MTWPVYGQDGDGLYRGCGLSAAPCASRLPLPDTPPGTAEVEADAHYAPFQADVDLICCDLEDQ